MDLGPLSSKSLKHWQVNCELELLCMCVSLCMCVCLCFQGLDIQRSRGPSLQSLASVKSTATSVNLYNKNSQVLTNGWDNPGCGAVCRHVFFCTSNMDDIGCIWICRIVQPNYQDTESLECVFAWCVFAWCVCLCVWIQNSAMCRQRSLDCKLLNWLIIYSILLLPKAICLLLYTNICSEILLLNWP